MRNAVILILMVATIVACNKKESSSSSSSQQLKNCKVEYLFFHDEIVCSKFQTLTFPAGPPYSLSCSYIRGNGLLKRVQGGFVPVPAGNNLLLNYMFSTDAYDSISQAGDSITVHEKFIDYQGAIHESPYNRNVYYLDASNRLLKIGRHTAFPVKYYTLHYVYSGNQVAEMIYDSILYRTFYFENGNLVRVNHDVNDQHGNLVYRYEILFQDYDSSPNPFRNQYYIRGSFFRAFSANNYASYTVNEYGLLTDSTFGITSHLHCSFPFTYTSDGYPAFGDY